MYKNKFYNKKIQNMKLKEIKYYIILNPNKIL